MAIEKKINILFVEDIPVDQELTERSLKEAGILFNSIRVDTEPEFIEAIDKFDPDIILSDYDMPTFDGMSALKIVLKKDTGIPFIIVTGALNEDIAVDCMKAGADDYVIKQNLNRLGQAVESAIKKKKALREKKLAERQLIESERKLKTLFSNLPGMAYRCLQQPDWPMSYLSEGCFSLTGYSADELINGQEINFGNLIHQDDKKFVWKKVDEAVRVNQQYELEYRIVDKYGKIKWVWERGICVYNEPGKINILEGFISDITESKTSREKLVESEKRFQYAMEATSDGLYDWNLQDNSIYFSPGYFTLLGYDPFELPNTFETYQELLHPEDAKLSEKWLQGFILEGKKHGNIEMRFKNKQGEWTWVLSRGKIVEYDEKGKPLRFVGTNVNIDQRKRNEAKILEINSQLSSIIESPKDTIIFSLDKNYCYTGFNTNHLNEMKKVYNVDIKIGHSMLDCITAKELKPIIKQTYDRVLSGESFSEIQKQPTLNIYYEFYWNPIHENDLVTGLSCFIQDVTEREHAREKIAESERKYRLLAENAVDVIWQMDLRLKFTYISPSVESVFGYTVDEWNGTKLSEHTTRIEFFKIARQALKIIENKEKINHLVFEAKMLRKNGDEFPVEISGRLLFDKSGLPLGLQGSTKDITERKLAEAEIFSMDNKLKLAMKAAKEGIWEWDLESDLIYQDDVILNMLGYKRQEIKGELRKGKWWLERVHDEDKRVREEIFNRYINGESDEYNVDFRLKAKTGNYVWVKSTAKFSVEDKNERRIIIGVNRDITEQKEAEKKIRENENFLNTLINAIPIPVFYKNLDGQYLGFNNAFTIYFGVTPTNRIGKTVFDFSPKDLARVYHEKDNELLENGGVQQYETVVIDTNNVERNVIFNKAVFTDNQGNIGGLIGTMLDVSELKVVEKELVRKNEEMIAAKENVELSEKRLKEAQSMAKLGNWELDLQTDKFFWSEEMYSVFEISPAKFEGTYEAYLDRIHLDDKDMVIQAFLEHLNNKKPFDIDFKIYLPDGSEKHVLQKCHSEFNVEGKVVKSYGTVQDITALKKVEQKLLKLNKELEQRVSERTAEIKKLSEAVIHSPTIVIITDPEGTIEYVNPKFTEVTGFEEHEAVGRNPRLLNGGYHDKESYTNMWRTIKSGKVWQGEMCNKKKNGEIFWEFTSVSSIKTRNQKITHFVWVKEDITLRKEMELELTKAKEEAEVANKAKSEFLANMSHEIRTPMNAVLGFSNLLSNMVEDELQKSYLDSIKSSGKSLLTLINDILDLSKIEAGKLELEFTYVDLHDIFNEMKSIFSLTSQEKGLEFIVEIEQGIPALFFMDEIRLRQILINLLSNAFKFTSKGRIVLTAKVKWLPQNSGDTKFCDLFIEVEDSGIGITEESRTKIFDSFSQQEGQSSKKYGGTGLGLTISQRLVNLMNGEIKLESKVNVGSTFTIVFYKVDFTDDKSEKKDSSNIDPSEIKFMGSRVLIIDDITDNRKYLAGALMNYNLDVIQAADGKEALELLKNNNVDLIITDLRMPELDGFELKKRLEKSNELRDIPVIATSASVMRSNQQKVKEANFSGFLIKPFQTKELLQELILHIPFESTVSQIEEIVSNENLWDFSISNKADFLEQFDELFLLHQPLKEQQAMQDVEVFSDKCISLAQDFDVPALSDYGDKLKNTVRSFDIELMLIFIDKFHMLYNKIKESVDDNSG